nr:MBOAT family protein [Lachnospiraceae bacterium]
SNRVTASELLDLGLNVREYIIFFIGVIVMFMVSMYGRDKSVREKLTKKPFIVRYIVFSIIFFSTLLFGYYGVGFDVKQFIYNQF